MGDVYMAKLAEQARPCALPPSCARTPARSCARALARPCACWPRPTPDTPRRSCPALVGHPTPDTWQAERYEEMVEYMKKVAVASETDLSLEERSAPSPLLRT